MYILLIILYVLSANSVAVPTGCFVAAWILAVIKLIIQTVFGLFKLSQGGDKK